MTELFHYLAQLAWYFKQEGGKEVEEIQLREFNRNFSDNFTTVDFDERLKLLRRARILSQIGSSYSFSYPYLYYYFVGKYLSDNLHKDDVREMIQSYCLNLHISSYANSILFLTHHRNDPWVIDQVVYTLTHYFYDTDALRLEQDVSAINTLVESAPKLLINNNNVEENQERSRELEDKLEEDGKVDGDTFLESNDEMLSLVARMNSLLRTARILGQILKNYYGSLERPKKISYLGEVFNAPMRMLNVLLEEILNEPDALIHELEAMIAREKPNLKHSDRMQYARRVTFKIIEMIITGIIIRTAQSVSYDKLAEDIGMLVKANKSTAHRLIGAATSLIQPGNLSFDKLNKLAKDIDSNPFAFTVFQSLVAYHIYMFHTKERDMQRLCQIAKIDVRHSRQINFRTKKSKLNCRA